MRVAFLSTIRNIKRRSRRRGSRRRERGRRSGGGRRMERSVRKGRSLFLFPRFVSRLRGLRGVNARDGSDRGGGRGKG